MRFECIGVYSEVGFERVEVASGMGWPMGFGFGPDNGEPKPSPSPPSQDHRITTSACSKALYEGAH